MVLGIGYAVLSQQLSINGELEYETMKCDVGFKTATAVGGTVNSNHVIADDKKSITNTCDIGISTIGSGILPTSSVIILSSSLKDSAI